MYVFKQLMQSLEINLHSLKVIDTQYVSLNIVIGATIKVPHKTLVQHNIHNLTHKCRFKRMKIDIHVYM